MSCAACSPVAVTLVSRIRKLLSAGLGKEDDENSTDHNKAAEDYDGNGPVVPGQHVAHRRQKARRSHGHGAQANSGLSV